eukprot:m.433056 g.433056  ORF g.433056 m.433056 type:complete len:297 (-) comp17521_c0_seq1:55-945(-)
MGDIDELFDVRNALHVGAYQQCINEANKLQLADDSLNEEKTVLMYRAMIGLGKYSTVKAEITEDASSDLQAVKRLASYLHRKADRGKAIEETRSLQDDGISLGNPVVALCSGIMYYYEGSYDEALRCLKGNKDAESIETSAMAIQTYVKMDRIDMAAKELKVMVKLNEDATLTQLATAWVNAGKGGEKLQEAFYNFEELAQKYGSTPLLLNGQGAVKIMQGKLEEAESLLQEAQEKNPNDPDMLVNMAMLAGLQGKAPEVAQRSIAQLQDSSPDHPLAQALSAKDSEFDACAAAFK